MGIKGDWPRPYDQDKWDEGYEMAFKRHVRKGVKGVGGPYKESLRNTPKTGYRAAHYVNARG